MTHLHALPDGRVVSGDLRGTIRIWTRSRDGEWQSEALVGHSRNITCLQVLPDGRIVSASEDKTLRIWDGIPVEEGVS